MKMIKDDRGRFVTPPIHTWFGMTQKAYFVAPRMILQSMPLEWQRQFIELVEELERRAPHMPTDYIVSRDNDPFSEYTYPDYNLLADDT